MEEIPMRQTFPSHGEADGTSEIPRYDGTTSPRNRTATAAATAVTATAGEEGEKEEEEEVVVNDGRSSNNKRTNGWSASKSTEKSRLTPVKQTYLEHKVTVPDTGDDFSFSWRKLWRFTGPGFLMSIAYLDPGNIDADLGSGSVAQFKLLWVLFWATALGLLLQRLAARLGVVTGMHLAELCHRNYPKFPRLVVWVMIEIAIIGSDMQEVIGTAVALYLLSDRKIPLYVGVLITLVDTFTFLLLDKYGLRKLEALFAFLIFVMAATFGYEYIVVKPDQLSVLEGIAIPYCSNCGNDALMQAVGMIGAIIMPHNLYLHSALVKSREVDRTRSGTIREANRYFFIEAAVALLISFVINLLVVSVFASILYGKSNLDVLEICVAAKDEYGMTVFPNNTDLVDGSIYNGGIMLGCQFGIACMYIWAIGILAAGQSSTMTGTYAGQFAMEGFLNLQWPRWKRVLFTRTVAILPTVLIASFKGIDDLTGLNNLLNTVMSIQLPFALIPTITFSSSVALMGEFANGIRMKIAACFFSFVILCINFYTVGTYVATEFAPVWYVYLGVAIVGVLYTALVLYLTAYLFITLGCTSLQSFLRIETPDYNRRSLENNSSSEVTLDHESVNCRS